MYEKQVIHAIQYKKIKEFHMRYRTYSSKDQRDKTFEMIIDGQDQEYIESVCCVTLTVTAETVTEQGELF